MKTIIYLLLASGCLGAPIWVERGEAVTPGLVRTPYRDTKSMRPVIFGDGVCWYQPYSVGDGIRVGDWVLFIRRDGVYGMHEVTAQNKRAIYTSGLNCRNSDGWTLKKPTKPASGVPGIVGIVRFIERPEVSYLAQVR